MTIRDCAEWARDRQFAPKLTGKASHLQIGEIDLSKEKTLKDGSKQKKTYEELAFPTRIRNSEVARFTRIITNHFPCGEYRKRFKLAQPIKDEQGNVIGHHMINDKCLCGKGGHRETRDHILFQCPFYLRAETFARKPFVGPYKKEHHDRQLNTWYHRRQRG